MDNRPIGIMDSGIGGLTVARVLHDQYGKENILFLGDNKRNPYGERSTEEILRFSEEMREFLLSKEVKMIIIACNTISFTVPLSFYDSTVPIIGMRPMVPLPEGVKTLSVFATPATIAGHRHREAFHQACMPVMVKEIPCEGLAHAIETGKDESTIEEQIRLLVEQYGVEDEGAALLACTHYPLVTHIFQKVLPHTQFIDPAETTVETAMGHLRQQGALGYERHAVRVSFTDTIHQVDLVRRLCGQDTTIHTVTITRE